MDASQHVARLFLRDLGRTPDAGGQAFWENRAKEVPPAQLNLEFREAAKLENPQAGQPRGSGMGTDPYSRIALPGEEGYTPDKSTNFFQQLAPFVIPIVAIVAPTLIPTIGSALLPAGASAAAVNAAGSAVINAAVTAAQGGDAGDILRSGAAGAAGGYAGTTASQAVKAAEAAGKIGISSSLPSGVVPAAAGGAAGTGARTLVETGDVGRSLQAAGLSGLASGAGQAASVTAQGALPAGTSRTTQALVAGGTGGATEAAIEGANPITSALGSALQTARVTSAMDADAARRAEEARTQQIISAFEQPTTPSTQFGPATAGATPARLPGYTTTEFDTPEFTASGRPIAGRFDPTIVGGEETLSPSDRLALDELRRAAITGDVQTLREVTQTGGLPTATPSTTINPALASTTGFTTRQPSTPTRTGGAAGLTGQTTTNRDTQILNLTGITKPTDALPGVEVTGQDELDRLPNVDVTGEEETEVTRKPTEDTIVSQRFPLTPDEPIIKRPPIIDYRSFNVFDPTFTMPPITTAMAPGSSALAQALGVGDPGVSYLSKKGKERKPVWNVESLKLSDELGGRYG
jgi:hypothetical protein